MFISLCWNISSMYFHSFVSMDNVYTRTQSTSSKPQSSVSTSSPFTDLSLAFSSSATKTTPLLSPAEGEVQATTADSSDHFLLQPKPTSGTLQDKFSSLDTGSSSNRKASKVGTSIQMQREWTEADSLHRAVSPCSSLWVQAELAAKTVILHIF